MFLITLAIIAILEWWMWRQESSSSERSNFKTRLVANLGLGALAIALSSSEQYVTEYLHIGVGLSDEPFGFDLSSWPYFAQLMIYILASTLLSYWTHRASHYYPLLWRFHGVHHSDLVVSASTSLRHHPGEVVLSMLVFFLLFTLLHMDAQPLLAGALALSSLSALLHTNIRLPDIAERFAWILPIPALHRSHHERAWYQSNRNFSQSFPLWDVIFRTYMPPPPKARITDYGDEVLGPLSALELFESAFRRTIK